MDATNEKWAEVLTAKNEIDNERHQLMATIKTLGHQNTELVKDNDTMSLSIADAYKRIHELESELETAHGANMELSAFESHIKTLLQSASA